MGKPIAVLAFSGGLDTSFCVAYLREQGYNVITVTVDTGGFTPADLQEIAARSEELGAIHHHVIDGRQSLWDLCGALHHRRECAARWCLSTLRRA